MYPIIKILDNQEYENIEFVYEDKLINIEKIEDFLSIRSYGEFAGKAFYLIPEYSWTLGMDNAGEVILIPEKVQHREGKH